MGWQAFQGVPGYFRGFQGSFESGARGLRSVSGGLRGNLEIPGVFHVVLKGRVRRPRPF